MEQEFHRIKRLPPYVFAEVNEMKARARAVGEDIMDFGMGNPDSATPPHIVEKLIETINDPDTKLILIDVKLNKFEYLTPQMAANQKYSVWFKYNINIKDVDDQSIDDWVVTGYGEQETGVFQGDEAFKRAIRIALRDTGANLSIKTQDEIENITNIIG